MDSTKNDDVEQTQVCKGDDTLNTLKPSSRALKRTRTENVKHMHDPLCKYNEALLLFHTHHTQTGLYELQAMAEFVWERTMTLKQILDILLVGSKKNMSSWTYVEVGYVHEGDYPREAELEHDMDPSNCDIMILRTCPSVKNWGPFVAEYFGYNFNYNHMKGPYYYLRNPNAVRID